jgi:hypothetical protein
LIFSLPAQIVNQNFGVYLLLDVERRCLDHQVRPVLFVLAAPDKLGIQVAIAAFIGYANGTSALPCTSPIGTRPWGCFYGRPRHG